LYSGFVQAEEQLQDLEQFEAKIREQIQASERERALRHDASKTEL